LREVHVHTDLVIQIKLTQLSFALAVVFIIRLFSTSAFRVTIFNNHENSVYIGNL